MKACWNSIILFVLLLLIIDPAKCVPRYPNAIFRIKNLESNDLRRKQSPRQQSETNIRASANAILLDILQRVISPGNLAIFRPAEPLSTNTNGRKWERLGWSW